MPAASCYAAKSRTRVTESPGLLSPKVQSRLPGSQGRRRCRHQSWSQGYLTILLFLSLEGATVSSGKWNPDMRVPPTPTPPKSAWQRRRYGSGDESSEDLPNRAALDALDMDDHIDEEDEWNKALGNSRRGDPMITDTPLPKQSQNRRGFANKATEARSESRTSRLKTDGGSESTIRKLHFDSPNDHSTPLRGTTISSQISPMPHSVCNPLRQRA
jgi:hypothetical protein